MDTDLEHRLSERMRRAQAGDRRAYEALLVEAAELVRGFVRKRARDQGCVEDIVQDTLLAIHRHRHTYDPARPFGPWMYAIARHRWLDAMRTQRRRNEVALVEETSASAQAVAQPGAATIWMQQALALLSKTQREVVQLLKLDGYSVAEVSQRTGLSETTVKVTAHRGYKTLRKLIVSPAHEE